MPDTTRCSSVMSLLFKTARATFINAPSINQASIHYTRSGVMGLPFSAKLIGNIDIYEKHEDSHSVRLASDYVITNSYGPQIFNTDEDSYLNHGTTYSGRIITADGRVIKNVIIELNMGWIQRIVVSQIVDNKKRIIFEATNSIDPQKYIDSVIEMLERPNDR